NPTPAPLSANPPTPLPPTVTRNSGRWIVLAMLLAACMAHATEPDDDYIFIYGTINGADNLNQHGDIAQAHAKYLEAQGRLLAFQKANPKWDQQIVAFRLKYLS